jgi:hypothetical protein
MSAAMVGLCRRLVPRLRRRSRYVDLMAERHRVLLGASVAILLLILSFAWALPLDRSLPASGCSSDGRCGQPSWRFFLSKPIRPT